MLKCWNVKLFLAQLNQSYGSSTNKLIKCVLAEAQDKSTWHLPLRTETAVKWKLVRRRGAKRARDGERQGTGGRRVRR